MTNEELRASLVAQLAALDAQKAQAELTVVLCAGNTWRTIQPVLEALVVQGLRLDVIAMTDERVVDPTRVILKDCVRYLPTQGMGAIATFRYLGDIPFRDRLDNLQAHARAKACAEARTDWVFFLDADVLLDPGTLRRLLAIAKDGDGIGAWCVRYNHVTDHPQWGATLMRTQLAREVGFNGNNVCGCVNLRKDLAQRGLQMVEVEGLSAMHLKFAQARTVVIGG